MAGFVSMDSVQLLNFQRPLADFWPHFQLIGTKAQRWTNQKMKLTSKAQSSSCLVSLRICLEEVNSVLKVKMLCWKSLFQLLLLMELVLSPQALFCPSRLILLTSTNFSLSPSTQSLSVALDCAHLWLSTLISPGVTLSVSVACHPRAPWKGLGLSLGLSSHL